MLSLIIHEIKSRWVAILAWGIGLFLFGALYISVFPEVSAQMNTLADLDIYKVMGLQLGSFEAYIASVVLLFIPLLLGVYCIISSTAALAGDEDRGTLEVIVAMPLARWQIFTAKVTAITAVAVLIMLLGGLGNAAVLAAVKKTTPISITPFDLFLALLGGLPLAFAFIMIGFFLGALLPSRRTAVLVMTIYFIASYFGENIAGMVKSIESVKYVSLFYYYDTTVTVFTEGIKVTDILILLGVAAVFFTLALVFFNKRNITVGAWPWQKGKITD